MDTEEDYFWERLLQAIESGRVVPIVGREALLVQTPAGPRGFDHLIATQLAASLRVDTAVLPDPFDLNDVVCGAANFRGTAPAESMSRIVAICQSSTFEPPECLRLLARIPSFQLFVSLTFDTLLEQAILQERGRMPAVAAYPSSTDHADFDQALVDAHGSMVFQLLGRSSPLRRFAVTEGQMLEGLHGVMSSDNRPRRLIDRLRDSHLLMIGSGLPDWPSRFLLRMARPGPLWIDRDTDEILADSALDGLPRFLHRFSPEHSLTHRSTALEFARELERRWFERHPRPGNRLPGGEQVMSRGVPSGDDFDEAPAAMEGGAVFVSYAREDRAAAFRLADRLAEANVDVWVDRRLEPGDAFRRVIERNIVNCSAFVAVLSGTTQDTSPRWYRREWSIACKQNEAYFGTGSNFIFPVIVDDSATRDHAATLSLFATYGSHAVKAPEGEPDGMLIQSLVRSQRQWRKLHAIRQ